MRQNKQHLSAPDLYREGTDFQFDTQEISLGPWSSYGYMTDPKHLGFVLSRYKFVAKMLDTHGSPQRTILEVGCGDGIGLPLICDIADKVIAADWDERLLLNISHRLPHLDNVSYRHIDFNKESADDLGNIDAAFMIDVIEHLEPENEEPFISNVVSCITNKNSGIMIVGTPNITASQYASKQSSIQHINLKSISSLCSLMEKYFYNVFMFGMNDEVLHTGYDAMCHYIWAVCSGVKSFE